jgi:hypothetical protein
MAPTNFERMLQLAEDVFSTHNDPTQLEVDEEVIAKLNRLHPATLSEHIDGDGPVVWILLIPTTHTLMQQFIEESISETELLNLTPVNEKYETIYLCSALVLSEYRKKGFANKLITKAIGEIRSEHPIQALFS